MINVENVSVFTMGFITPFQNHIFTHNLFYNLKKVVFHLCEILNYIFINTIHKDYKKVEPYYLNDYVGSHYKRSIILITMVMSFIPLMFYLTDH